MHFFQTYIIYSPNRQLNSYLMARSNLRFLKKQEIYTAELNIPLLFYFQSIKLLYKISSHIISLCVNVWVHLFRSWNLMKEITCITKTVMLRLHLWLQLCQQHLHILKWSKASIERWFKIFNFEFIEDFVTPSQHFLRFGE